MTEVGQRRFVSLGATFADEVHAALRRSTSTPKEVQGIRDECARRCAGYVTGRYRTVPGWAVDQVHAYAALYQECCQWLEDHS